MLAAFESVSFHLMFFLHLFPHLTMKWNLLNLYHKFAVMDFIHQCRGIFKPSAKFENGPCIEFHSITQKPQRVRKYNMH